MDSKQYTGKYFPTGYEVAHKYLGLGRYLSEIDPRNRDVTWQLQHIIIFCRVHFQRSIFKAIGSKSQGTSLWSRMMSILDSNSEHDYDHLLDLLISITPY
jgi:hypothetical protein